MGVRVQDFGVRIAGWRGAPLAFAEALLVLLPVLLRRVHLLFRVRVQG